MRIALWFLALAALVLGSWLIWGGGWSDQFTLAGSVQWLESNGPWAWLMGILLLMGDLVLPIPGTVVISALGYLYGTLIGGAIATVGLMASGLLGYGLGRLFTPALAQRWLGQRDYALGKRIFENGGGWAVALSKAVPILPEVIACTAGLLRMPFARFVVSLACGSLPMGFLFAAIGKAGHDTPGISIALSLILPALLWLAASRVNRGSRNFDP